MSLSRAVAAARLRVARPSRHGCKRARVARV